MALNLKLECKQRNDCKVITFKDASDWSLNNIDVSSIQKGQLMLKISIQRPLQPIVEYEPIDLYDKFGPFTNISDLEFNLKVTDVFGLDTKCCVFPDGIYTINYTYIDGEDVYTLNRDILIDGLVHSQVYRLMLNIPLKYACCCPNERKIFNIIYCYSYLQAMHVSTTIVDKVAVLNELLTLENILKNGNPYTW
jgi:hypothetical protein